MSLTKIVSGCLKYSSAILTGKQHFSSKVLDQSQAMADIPEWFHGARLNFAENLLHYDDDKVALYMTGMQTLLNQINN